MQARNQPPEGSLPREQRWTVSFLNDAVRREFKSFNTDLRDAFWNLHNDIKYFGLGSLNKSQAKRLAGTQDLWELRFKAKSGIGRGLYVQKTGRTIIVLIFFTKKSDKLPTQILDLATDRRKQLEKAIVEAIDQERMAVKLIDAQSVFDEEYPPGSKKRAAFQSAYLERVRKRQRIGRIKESFLTVLRAKTRAARIVSPVSGQGSSRLR